MGGAGAGAGEGAGANSEDDAVSGAEAVIIKCSSLTFAVTD